VTDPQVVLQAHALRAKASIEALLHGTRRVRVQRTLLGPLWGSIVLAAIVAVVIVVAGRIVAVLHHTGH
jgi:ABC-type polysaccharide/polyol phosphate export permease